MVRTLESMGEQAFREKGITLAIRTAILRYSDAQLLCKNNRISSAYLLAIRGLEEVGRAILLNNQHDYDQLRNHKLKLKALFSNIPRFDNIDEKSWAEHFTDEANCARFVDTVKLGSTLVWISPLTRFRVEETIRDLYESIKFFVESIFKNDEIEQEYMKMDPVCGQCADFGSSRNACGKPHT